MPKLFIVVVFANDNSKDFHIQICLKYWVCKRRRQKESFSFISSEQVCFLLCIIQAIIKRDSGEDIQNFGICTLPDRSPQFCFSNICNKLPQAGPLIDRDYI